MRILRNLLARPAIVSLRNGVRMRGLEKALHDEDWITRRDAADALGQLGNWWSQSAQELGEDMRRSLVAEHDPVRQMRISRRHPAHVHSARAVQVVHVLQTALADPVPAVRLQAVTAIGKLRLLPAFESLIAALKDDDATVRSAAAAGLVGWASAYEFGRAVDPLIGLLTDDDPGVRSAAAQPLRAFLNCNPSSKNVAAALAQLAQLGGPAAHHPEADLDAIRKYTRHLAMEWWKSRPGQEATCDACNVVVPRDAGYLLGSWLRCESCGDEAFGSANAMRLHNDPDFYGPGVLKQARRFVART